MRVDDLQNGYFLIQDPARFCFGMDAVLLSAFVDAADGNRICDLCTGGGIIPILLAARTDRTRMEGLEIQEDQARMAVRSVRMNGLEDRIGITVGDVKEAARIYGAASFHVVTCNPPYMVYSGGKHNADMAKTIARHEVLCTFADVASQASRLLVAGGKFYLVHRPFRLTEILTELSANGLEPKRMRLVYPYVHKAPNLVLIEARKGGRAHLTVEPPLVVFDSPGVYTPEVRRIYGQ